MHYTGPIVDSHVHLLRPDLVPQLLRGLDGAGVARVMILSLPWPEVGTMNLLAHVARWMNPDRIGLLAAPDMRGFGESHWVEKQAQQLAEEKRAGAQGIKLLNGRPAQLAPRVFFYDPRFRPIFEIAATLQLPVLLHVADVEDRWCPGAMYHDNTLFPSRELLYHHLERLLYDFPDVQFVIPHMAGHPCELEHVARLLDAHDNMWVDTSSLWAYRAMVVRPKRTRAFVVDHADRVLFGGFDYTLGLQSVTDSRLSQTIAHGYRRWRRFLETDDSWLLDWTTQPGGGLDLPDDVLSCIYWQNASVLFGPNPVEIDSGPILDRIDGFLQSLGEIADAPTTRVTGVDDLAGGETTFSLTLGAPDKATLTQLLLDIRDCPIAPCGQH